MNRPNLIITIVVIMLLFVTAIVCSMVSHADYEDNRIWTNKMIALHDAANTLRKAGYSDDSEVIRALSEAWWSEYHDFCIVAKVIEGEAGGCEWDQMVYVGAVIINRVNSPLFPNTVEDVVAAPGQYSTLYLQNFETIQPRVWKAAKAAMDGDHDAPWDLYWQAEFPQGKEIWKIFRYESHYYSSTTYFCRGTVYD